MTAMSADPRFAGVASGRPFTVHDLEAMPDDGHRYELIDGMLIVTSSCPPACWTACASSDHSAFWGQNALTASWPSG